MEGKLTLKNIVGIRFKKLGKIYFFNPKEIKLKKGDKIIGLLLRKICEYHRLFLYLHVCFS